MEIKGNKTYYFVVTLIPAEECRDFNPGELNLGDNYRLDIFFNGLTIWNPRLKANFNKVYPFVRESLDVLIAAFIFREHAIYKKRFKLSYNIQRCIEAMKVKAERNLIWTLDYPGRIYSPSREALVNVTWRRVAKYFKSINSSREHKLMLKDYRSCINDPGDNAFFFAYRIIEDIRIAINLEKGKTKENCWDQLHLSLKTDEKFIKPLTDVATKVRHGELKSPLVIAARKKNKRNKILNIAFELMKREFKRKFAGFL